MQHDLPPPSPIVVVPRVRDASVLERATALTAGDRLHLKYLDSTGIKLMLLGAASLGFLPLALGRGIFLLAIAFLKKARDIRFYRRGRGRLS